jgi:fructose-1,6-bisphosphatase I
MPAEIADFLQPGSKLVAAGYAVYGAKTSFVYSAGDGTHEFTLDPDIGEFMLTEEFVRIPEQGTLYSVNEGNSYQWSKPIQDYVDSLKQPDTARGTPLSARYVGSLVADFDRNMKKGGIYLYPPDKKNTSGKLRLLYECIPLAFIAEQAGGKSTDGTRSVLEIIPQDIHQRSPLYIGSTREVQSLIAALAGRAARS